MTQTLTAAEAEADRALKGKHKAMWALGDYPAVAADVITGTGERLVEAVGVTDGERVLDVAAGSGNASVPAARRGATVVASDLCPELLEAGRSAAPDLPIAWEEGDAEALPYANASFDVVLSCVGVMFAPHHQPAADELLRVLRPGGRVGLLSWTPEGFIGQMFAAMRPYAAPPPPGAQPPPLWGSEEHVRELFGDRVTDVVVRRETAHVTAFGSAEEFVDFFKASYGPTIATYRFVGDDPERAAALDAALVELARGHDRGDGAMEWEYLLLTAVRA